MMGELRLIQILIFLALTEVKENGSLNLDSSQKFMTLTQIWKEPHQLIDPPYQTPTYPSILLFLGA